MSALGSIWTIIAGMVRIDDDTTRITLTDIGIALTGDKFEITGAGGTTLYEGLQFTATRITDDTVDIDWLEHGLTAPDDTWTSGGMVRLYQAPAQCAGAMRVSFNPHNISAITSTGNAGEFDKDNVLSSNRGTVHTLDGGSDHQMVATVEADSLITSVALIDYDGGIDLDAQIRIRGDGAVSPIDVVYPALAERYQLKDRPPPGFPGMVGGHNINDLARHFIAYVPPMSAGSVTVDILNPTNDVEFSELLLSSFWTPVRAKNMDFGSVASGAIMGADVWRGDVMHRRRDGLNTSQTFSVRMMSEADCTFVDLMMKSGRTMIFDLYPLEVAKRWRAMAVGYLSGDTAIEQLSPGMNTELSVIDTKLHPGI